MHLQAQPTQVFSFFGRYLLERQLAAILKIAGSGQELGRDQCADDATSPGQAEGGHSPSNAS
jgi:hypothetical protein